LAETTIVMLIVACAAGASLSFWNAGERSSMASLEQGRGYAAANAALAEARSMPFPACSAGLSPAPCALPGGLPAELAAAGFTASATARLVAPAPAEAGAYTPSTDLVLIEATARSARGGVWRLSALQRSPSP
jgi:hypothetical protein